MLPHSIEQEAAFVLNSLPKSTIGTYIGQFKREDFIPSHGLALSNHISQSLPSMLLDRQEALKYLKRKTLRLRCPFPKDGF
jgi:NOL1/NOP2/fmu family ribosome biogenesis protein